MLTKSISQIQTIIQQLKQQLLSIYQDRLVQLILFGSQARGDAKSDSDIDILVVLKGEVNPVTEIKQNSDWISELCLEHDKLINCFYISENELNNQENSLIINIKKEGILL